MIPILLAAVLPGLLLREVPADAGATLKQLPEVRLYVPSAEMAKWTATGIAVKNADSLKDYVRVPAPRVKMQTAVAAATALPWVDSNGWRIERGARKILYADLPEKSAVVAAAEAFAFGADAVIEPAPADVPALLQMLSFLKEVDQPEKPVVANIGLVDNGSAALPEVMNLLTRRNLLYRLVKEADASLDLNVEVGSREFPAKDAANPHEFAQKVRAKLGDEKRVLRLFNTTTAIGRVTRDGAGTRVHLLNYGTRSIPWVQVRVLGSYAPGQLRAFAVQNAALADFRSRDGGAEFTIPMLHAYAVVDLPPATKALLLSKRGPADLTLTADPDAPAWRNVAPVVIESDYNGKAVPGHRTEVRSLWTPEFLHVLFVNRYDSLNLKPNPDTSAETQRLWDWDVSEIFLGSDFDRITRYKEFQVSPQGEWLDLDIDREDMQGQAGAKWNSGVQVKARVDAAKKIWYGEFRIPFRDLGVSAPAVGTELRAGIFRMAGAAPNRKYLSWQVTDGKTFHMPQNFGIIRLVSQQR